MFLLAPIYQMMRPSCPVPFEEYTCPVVTCRDYAMNLSKGNGSWVNRVVQPAKPVSDRNRLGMSVYKHCYGQSTPDSDRRIPRIRIGAASPGLSSFPRHSWDASVLYGNNDNAAPILGRRRSLSSKVLKYPSSVLQSYIM